MILECQNCGVPDDGHALSACIATLTVRAEKAEARVAELELGIKRLVWANDGTTAERPDIAWRDLKRLVCTKETT